MDVRIQQEAILAGIVAVEHRGHLLADFVRGNICQETEATAVHAKHWRFVFRQGPGRAEQAAVSAGHDHQVGLLADLVPGGDALAMIRCQLDQALLYNDLEPPGIE